MTEKLMKARGRRPSTFIVSKFDIGDLLSWAGAILGDSGEASRGGTKYIGQKLAAQQKFLPSANNCQIHDS